MVAAARRSATALLILFALTLGASNAQQPAGPSATDQALTQLKQGEPQQALDLLERTIAADPGNAAANLLAASCAIALYRADLAVSYGERARALEPDNWKVDTTLVTAYAMAGETRKRDAERAALHALHTSGKVQDAAETSGFLLDRFKAKRYSADAVEYFTPVGRFHIYYRFVVHNHRGQRAWQIDVQSDDFNQASWAKAYPEQAAGGQRQFQITGEGEGVRSDYRSFSGSPNYDWIRARVIEILDAQSGPFPGEPSEASR